MTKAYKIENWKLKIKIFAEAHQAKASLNLYFLYIFIS